MNKKNKREAGRLKAEKDLAQSIADGLSAQRAEQIWRKEREQRMADKARKVDAENEARLRASEFFANIMKEEK